MLDSHMHCKAFAFRDVARNHLKDLGQARIHVNQPSSELFLTVSVQGYHL